MLNFLNDLKPLKSFKIFLIVGIILLISFVSWFLYCERQATLIGPPDGQWAYFEFIIALYIIIPVYLILSISAISIEYINKRKDQ